MPERRHDMPFGAQITPEGVRFRLWAPGCEQVGLCIENGRHEPVLAMTAAGDGWFEYTHPRAGAGTLYRFEIDGGPLVPDPVSRFNPHDVHGESEVIDPASFDWQDDAWRGHPWETMVIYELHVGAFSPEGTFDGVRKRLGYLKELGITAIELMPVADFPGTRNWGYDGVLPFAPDSSYGRPEDLKALVQAAHANDQMILLDVVYNHFGPEGNYLHLYAKQFFNENRHTPWGAAINFDCHCSKTVREFFIQNALYWLDEYHFDGLRLDAVQAISDDSKPHILTELAERVHAGIDSSRHVHLILENDANEARYLGSDQYQAQWNDDFHHALHVLCTGEVDGYYADYADQPIRHLGRCLAEGFAYQGEASPYRQQAPRGEASAHLRPQAFVSFLQCHDQVGNRAFGERITALAPAAAVRAAVAVSLLAPSIPMLFMGEEFAATSPFLYFCDFGGELRDAVTRGRRREFEHFGGAAAKAVSPDPNLEQTFLLSKLDWTSLDDERQMDWRTYYRDLLTLRRHVIVPLLGGMRGYAGTFDVIAPFGLRVTWRLGQASTLWLLANFSNETVTTTAPSGKCLFATAPEAADGLLGPWAVVWTIAMEDGDT